MQKAFHVRLASWALLAVPIGMIVFLVALLVLGGTSPPGVTRLLVGLSVICLLIGVPLRFTTRFLIPAVVISPLLMLFALAIQLETGLLHPESFFDFATAFVTVSGPLVCFLATVTALVKRRRGTLGPPRQRDRRLVVVGGSLVAAVLLASVVLTLTQPSAAGVPRGTVLVRMRDSVFIPDEYRYRVGERVRFFVRNEDSFAHTFSVDGWDIDEYIGPGAGRLISVRVEQLPRIDEFGMRTDPDTALYCRVTGHEDMTAAIRVE